MTFFAAQMIHADDIADKQKIYETLTKLDDVYQADGFLINRSSVHPYDWIVSPSAVQKNYGKVDLTAENISRITRQKMADLEKAGICTGKYIASLRTRLRAKKVLSFGMLLVDHPFGDLIFSLKVDKASFDYLILNDNPDEPTDPVLIANDLLTAKEVQDWHKRRITIRDSRHAEYVALYSEVGLHAAERTDAFYVVSLVRDKDDWKIDNISIRSADREQIMLFHKKSMSQR
jgi:hypothetical protein